MTAALAAGAVSTAPVEAATGEAGDDHEFGPVLVENSAAIYGLRLYGLAVLVDDQEPLTVMSSRCASVYRPAMPRGCLVSATCQLHAAPNAGQRRTKCRRCPT